MLTPPLVAEIEAGRRSFRDVIGGKRIGVWTLFFVPLRLLPYRSAARHTIGVFFLPEGSTWRDVHDLRVRHTERDGPCWVFAVRSALLSKAG